MTKKMKKKLYRILLAIFFYLLALLLKLDNTTINIIFFLLAYLIVGYDIILKAIRNIGRGKVFDENFLMTIATIGAILINELEEAVAVMLFYQIGELFQSYAVDKSRKSITSLMDIRPDYANCYRNEEIVKINPQDVNVGEIILIKKEEKVPLDGIVIEGTSRLDTKALTGESFPININVNDKILSGSINIEGLLKVKVEKEFKESTVSKILNLVENASSKKSKSENFISKFAKYYTPIVVLTALVIAIFPPILTDIAFKDWLYRALSFLVVSCPCALVISIPLSFFAGIGASSKNGILVKGSNYLEALSNSKIVVCDKTGTLTEGVFKVQKIIPLSISKEELLKYTSYAENFSLHPIALSIKEAYGKDIDETKIEKVKEFKGMGIKAKVFSKEILVGNEKLMEENNISYQKTKEVGTIIYIAINKKFSGTIIISDKIKEDSYKAIEDLRANNISKIIMLTGDIEAQAKEVSKELKLDNYHASLLPQEKVAKVEKIMKEKDISSKLIFVGDGINDAPVLALSDIGIAMGSLGSDAAIEAADIVIMTDELSKIATAIKISKKTMNIVKENIFFAITVKIIILIISALGLASMWAAVFADVGVSVIAIINSLRILYYKVK